MLKLFEEVNLLQQMLPLLLLEIADLNLLYGHQLPSCKVKPLEHLSTRPSAHDLSNLLRRYTLQQ